MIPSLKRLIVALAFVVPAAALVTSPVMAASHHHRAKHHASAHKVSAHKTRHARKNTTPTAS